MAITTWNPSDKTAGVTLTNSNLTAGWTAKQNGVRATAPSYTSGKYYFEFSGTGSGGFIQGIGIANASETFTSGNGGPGTTANSIGWYGGSGVFINGSSVGSAGNFNSTKNAVAVDFGGKLIWFYTFTTGDWNNSGTANPATGTGGISISGMASGPYFICTGCDANGAATMVLNAGSSSFLLPVPTGFSAWGASLPTFDATKSMFRLVGR